MIRNLLISSAFMFASTVIFASSANADDPMAYGTLATSCYLSKLNDGVLAVNDISKPTRLSSTLSGGTPAKVNIDCDGDAQLTISKPDQTKGTTSFGNLTATATNTALGLNVSSNSTSPATGDIFADTQGEAIGTIEINLVADNGAQNIVPGEYEFTVTLTSTP